MQPRFIRQPRCVARGAVQRRQKMVSVRIAYCPDDRFTVRSMPLYHFLDISVSAPFSCNCWTVYVTSATQSDSSFLMAMLRSSK